MFAYCGLAGNPQLTAKSTKFRDVNIVWECDGLAPNEFGCPVPHNHTITVGMIKAHVVPLLGLFSKEANTKHKGPPCGLCF